MAQRDYVKKKSNSKKNNSRIIPNIMMAIAVVLVILFIAILYFVSNNKSTKPATSPQVITEKPQMALPDKPQERWTYLKELENPDGSNSQINQQAKSSEQDKERQQILDSFIKEKQQSNQTTQVTNNTNNNNVVNSANQQQNSQVSTSTDKWHLQCGAFKDKSNAESLKAKLAMLGVTSFIKNEKFYRVLVGPYNSKHDAEKAINSLKNNGISSCIATTK